jgi:hypothetical protein
MNHHPLSSKALAVLIAITASAAKAADFDIRNASEFAKCVSTAVTLERLGTDMKSNASAGFKSKPVPEGVLAN